jgi:hypothetical protein
VRRLNEIEWETLKRQLREEFTTLEETIKELRFVSDEQFKEVFALIPHVAYHLGAIRQIAILAKNKN